ncbi:hypothetical protein KNE206_74490 [Kitasatospora sp. NE20-6]
MGFNAGLLVYADGDVAACLRQAGASELGRTIAMTRRLTPGRTVEPTAPVSLWQGMCPPFGHACAARFPDTDIVCDQRLIPELSSALSAELVAAGAGRRLVLHAMNSAVDWSAFAVREDGRLVRSLAKPVPRRRIHREHRRAAPLRSPLLGR